MSLVGLLEQGQLWRGSYSEPFQTESVESSGYAPLDERLVGSGWLQGQLVELLYSGEGRGEVRLLWPLLKRFSATGRSVFWVDPPYYPYPLALIQAGIGPATHFVVRTDSRKERLWAIEQVLKSGASPLVLGWLDTQVSSPALRRLQIAAQAGGGLGWMMRPNEVCRQASSAAYRLLLNNPEEGVELTLLKRRGGWPLPPFVLELPEVI